MSSEEFLVLLITEPTKRSVPNLAIIHKRDWPLAVFMLLHLLSTK